MICILNGQTFEWQNHYYPTTIIPETIDETIWKDAGHLFPMWFSIISTSVQRVFPNRPYLTNGHMVQMSIVFEAITSGFWKHLPLVAVHLLFFNAPSKDTQDDHHNNAVYF